MEAVLAFLKVGAPDEAASLTDLRQWVDGLGGGLDATDVEREDTEIAGVPVVRFGQDSAAPAPAILYLHGGAFVAGSRRSHGSLAAAIAQASGLVTVLPEYRLAPEHPFPAALDDARRVYLHLTQQGRRIALVGDSAGGGLALSLSLDLWARGAPPPACLSLISPWTDLTLSGASIAARADLDPMITLEALQAGAAAYCGALPTNDPRVSPLFADLSALPPVQIQVGSRERVYDDACRLFERAKIFGVDVSFREWPEMIHVWPLFGNWLTEGPQAVADIALHVVRHTRAAV